MSHERPTLADVARRAGVSPTDAGMVLGGRADTRLPAEAHVRVIAAATELAYRPLAKVHAEDSRTIAFVSDVIATTRFATGLISGALDAAQEDGHVLLVLETGGEVGRVAEAVDAAAARGVDGIIFGAMRAREVYVPPIPQDIPVVMLNSTSVTHPVSVLPDEVSGGRAAIAMLQERGHRDGIAIIGHDRGMEQTAFRSVSVARRLAGIRFEMESHGMGFVAEMFCWDWEPEDGYEATRTLLARRKDVSALVCMNDRLAFGAYQAVAEAGLRVPEDLSIVSFDNDEISGYLRPRLSTVGLPHEQMGLEAVELLLHPDGQNEHLIPMPLLRRESIAQRR